MAPYCEYWASQIKQKHFLLQKNHRKSNQTPTSVAYNIKICRRTYASHQRLEKSIIEQSFESQSLRLRFISPCYHVFEQRCQRNRTTDTNEQSKNPAKSQSCAARQTQNPKRNPSDRITTTARLLQIEFDARQTEYVDAESIESAPDARTEIFAHHQSRGKLAERARSSADEDQRSEINEIQRRQQEQNQRHCQGREEHRQFDEYENIRRQAENVGKMYGKIFRNAEEDVQQGGAAVAESVEGNA